MTFARIWGFGQTFVVLPNIMVNGTFIRCLYVRYPISIDQNFYGTSIFGSKYLVIMANHPFSLFRCVAVDSKGYGSWVTCQIVDYII